MNSVDGVGQSTQTDLDDSKLLDPAIYNNPAIPPRWNADLVNPLEPTTGSSISLNTTYASRQGIDLAGLQSADLNEQYKANQTNLQQTGDDPALDHEKTELLLDLTQMGLDIAGLIDPTPISDGVNGVISLFRGDWLGAGISAVSMIPYIGDLAKAGKLPKVLKSVERAVEIASKDAKFAERLRPVLRKIKEGLDAVPFEKLPDSIRKPLEAMKTKIDNFFTAARKEDTFVGEVRGQRVELSHVRNERFNYTKRDRVQYDQLRKEFDSHGRADFLKSLSKEKEKELRAAGLNDAEIALVKEGKVPQGWQVHHKKPLDDGGDNSFNNLVLIKNDPFHQAITNAQKRLVGDLKPGETRVVDFPIPEGSIYPPKP